MRLIMACSLDNTRKLFRKKGILNRFNELTEDTGTKVSEFNQLAYQIKQLGIAKFGELPEGARTAVRLDGKKAVFNPIFFEWVDRKNAEGTKPIVTPIETAQKDTSNFYQLTDLDKLQKNDIELDNFLLDFLTPFGVKSEQLDEMKERFGVDALGVTDVLNKLIYYSGNRNIETIPEEFGHMISFLMGAEHPVMKQLLEEITKWEEFKDVWNEYYAAYNYNGAKVRLEAVGKLIAKRLVAQYKESKEAPKTGLNALVDKIIKEVMNFFKRIFDSGYYSMFLADKIAAQVLIGNRDFVYEGYPELKAKVSKFTPVDYEKALADNPLASYIMSDYGEAFGNVLVGSLAIAGQGERILRSPDEPIHDMDFIVKSEDAFQAVVAKLMKNNSQPVHFGIANTNNNFTTYAYFITPKGYTVEIPKRDKNGWPERNSDNSFKIIVRNEDGLEVPNTPENVMPVDFFVYPNEFSFNENIIDNKFSSWQNIFFGKLSLSPVGASEIMFKRGKDQVDYIFNNPVQRTFKPHPAFLFYQLDSNKNTIDNSYEYEREKLENLRLKQLKSQINRKKELEAIRGKENRLEVQARLRIIENSIEELQSAAGIQKFFNVAFYDISVAQSILNKKDDEITAFDLNEVVRILSVLEGFDITMGDIITNVEEKQYVIAIRNKIAELTPKFHKKLAIVVEKIGKSQGFDMTYQQITKAVEDLNKASSLLYSPEESHIPILRILASVLNSHESDVREERLSFMQKYEEMAEKYRGFDYSAFIENGHLILPYVEKYYEEEAKYHIKIKEIKEKIQDFYKSKSKEKYKVAALYQERDNAIAQMFRWYTRNHTYYLTPEMEQEYLNDLKAKKESLIDPMTGEVDQEAFKAFEKEYSPYKNGAGYLNNQPVQVGGRTYKVFTVTSSAVPEGRWYRYLTAIPKTEGEVNWSNPKYEQVKDNELYKYIVETLSESLSKVPHDLYSETAGPHKILRKIMYDATSNSFALRTWGADALDTIKDWWSIDLSSSEIENRYKGVTDAAGREKATIQAPSIQDIKGSQNPLELTKKFFELASEYDNATKVVPITDLLQYTLSQMDAVRTNSITGQMYNVLIQGAKEQPEVVERGLVNAMKSAKYKTDSVLSKKTRLDEYNIKISQEEFDELREKEKEWENNGMIGPRPTLRKTSHVVIMDSITDFTRLNLIGLKPFTAAANILVGISSNFIHAARKKDFEDKHLFKATKVLFESLFKLSRTKYATQDAIKLTLLAEKFGVVLNLFEGQDRGNTQISKAVNKLMYLMQERGEYTIHTQLMLAMMYAKKVTNLAGKEKNLWDAFVLKQDKAGNTYLSWNEQEFGTQELWQNRNVLDAQGLNISNIKKFQDDLRRVRIATQGDYQNALMGKAQWYGRMAFLFRTWLPSAIRQRFGKEIEGEFKGRYRTWGQYLKSSYKKEGFTGFFGNTFKTASLVALKTFVTSPLSVVGLKSLSKGLNESYENSLKNLGLSELDVENMRANIRELQMILFLAIIAGALKQLADDDDDPELTFSINLGQRLNQDLTFFMNPDSAMAVIKDPIPTFKTFQDVTDVIVAISNKIQDPEKDIYQRGRHKGESKVSKELIDLFPGWSGIRSTIGVTAQEFGSQTYKYKK